MNLLYFPSTATSSTSAIPRKCLPSCLTRCHDGLIAEGQDLRGLCEEACARYCTAVRGLLGPPMSRRKVPSKGPLALHETCLPVHAMKRVPSGFLPPQRRVAQKVCWSLLPLVAQASSLDG